MKTMIELFSGSGIVAKTFQEAGYKTLTIDNNSDLKPNIVADILLLNLKDIPKEFRNPDVIWASPPCQTFSVMTIGHYWNKDGTPKRSKTYIGLALALKTKELIEELKPKIFFIENPTGMLRKQKFMISLHRKTVTYCQYGMKYRKSTDIWTNAVSWIPRSACKVGSSCHEEARRGMKRGIQGVANPNLPSFAEWKSNAYERGIIPEKLCQEVVNFCQGKAAIVQQTIEVAEK